MKKIIISQPRYLPVINYLQRLYWADLFVFFDNVKRDYSGWENRNKILSLDDKESWVTIPILSSRMEIINKTIIKGNDWVTSHKSIIKNAYKKHPYYKQDFVDKYFENVENVIAQNEYNYSPVLIQMLNNACELFEFTPKIVYSRDYSDDSTSGVNKLLQISKNTKCDIYVSGENGREYGVEGGFSGSGIEVKFHEFDYPKYSQYNSNTFHPWLCFFDVLFNIGLEETGKIIKTEWDLLDN